MRALGVKWRPGRLPVYPAGMTDAAKKAADVHYDAMSDDFVNAQCERRR